MSGKKVFLLAVFLMLIMGLFPNAVSAQEDGGIGQGLGSAFETIRDLFAFLPEMLTLDKLVGEDPAATFWAKFLVWVLLFAVVYFGAGFVFTNNKNIAIVVALVISLMGALLIPSEFIVSIFKTYGFVSAVIVWVIPLAAGIFVAHKFENKFIRAIIYWIAAWILLNINAVVLTKGFFSDISFPYFGIMLVVVFILAIWNTIGAFGGAGAQEGAANRFFDIFKGRGDRGNFPDPHRDTQGFWGRRRQRQTEQAEQVLTREQRIQKLNEKMDNISRDYDTKIAKAEKKEIILLQEAANIIESLKEAVTEMIGLTRRTRNGDINQVKIRYKELMDKLINDLKGLLNNLKQERRELGAETILAIKSLRDNQNQEFSNKKEEFLNRRSVLDQNFGLHKIVLEWNDVGERINEIEKELQRLFEQEVEYERGKKTTIEKEEMELNDEIRVIQGLVDFIDVQVGERGIEGFMVYLNRKNKKIRVLSIEQLERLKEEIIKVYEHLKMRGNQEQIIRTRYEPIIRHINASIEAKLQQLGAHFQQLDHYEKQWDDILKHGTPPKDAIIKKYEPPPRQLRSDI